jgi:Tol biopolymer transport system component
MQIKRIVIRGICLIGFLGIGLGIWWHFLTLSRVTNYSIGEIDPSPSPDGQWLIFRSYTASAPESGELWIRSASDPLEAPRQLISGPKFNGGVSWSPDGRWFSYTEWTDGETAGTVESHVFRMNPRTGQKIQLTHGHGQQIREGTSWNKNNQIAFICGSEICTLPAEGGSAHKLSSLVDENVQIAPEELAWSPDGQRMVFSGRLTSDNEEHSSIWLLNMTTGKAERLTNGPWDGWPVWIEDDTVVFCHRPESQNTLVLSRVSATSRRVSRVRSDAIYFSPGYAAQTGDFFVARSNRFDWSEKDSNPFRGFHIFRLNSRALLFW